MSIKVIGQRKKCQIIKFFDEACLLVRALVLGREQRRREDEDDGVPPAAARTLGINMDQGRQLIQSWKLSGRGECKS